MYFLFFPSLSENPECPLKKRTEKLIKGAVSCKTGPFSAPVWLSYASGLCSLFCFITSFLNDLCIISLSILSVPVLQGLSASYWEKWHKGNWCQLLDSDWGCEHSWPLLSAPEARRVFVSATGANSIFNLQPLGQGWYQHLGNPQMCVFVKLGNVVRVLH